MRKCHLGKPSARNPRDTEFKLPRAETPKTNIDKMGRPSNMVATYWPSRKGGFRMQLLRRYWHIKMPYLLDVWPHVHDWSSSVEMLPWEADGKKGEFTASFRVQEAACSYAVYLYEDGKPNDGDEAKVAAREAKHERLALLFSERGDHLRFMSRSQLETHPHLESAKEIFYHRYWDWPNDLPRDVAVMVSRKEARTLGDLLGRVGGGDATWHQLLSLISNGHIDVDLDDGLGKHTAVTAARIEGHV